MDSEHTAQTEPLLINRFRMNESNMRAFAKEHLRITILLNYLFSVPMLALAVYTAVVCFRTSPLELRLLFRPLVSLAIAGFLFYEARTIENRAVSKAMERIEQQVGKRDSTVTLRFCEDCYFSGNSEFPRQTRREYADVIHLSRGNTWINLTVQSIGGFILDPAGFENGGEDDFWKLMNEKCPKAVPKAKRI